MGTHLSLATANRSRPDRTRFVEPGENFRDTAWKKSEWEIIPLLTIQTVRSGRRPSANQLTVGHQKLAGNVTRSDAHQRQLHYPPADDVGQGPTVDEHAAELVDTCLTWNERGEHYQWGLSVGRYTKGGRLLIEVIRSRFVWNLSLGRWRSSWFLYLNVRFSTLIDLKWH